MILSGFGLVRRRSSGSTLGGAILTAIVGLGLLIAGAWMYLRVSKAERWPIAPGKIEESHIETSKSAKHGTKYYCRVSYVFEVGGRQIHGRKLAVGDEPTSSDGANEKMARYPAGGDCTVHYDPADPGDSCLEIGDPIMAWVLSGVGALLLIFGGVQTAKRLLT